MKYVQSVLMIGLLMTASLATQDAFAQEDEEAAVMAVVNGLFDAMRAGDGDAVRELFFEDAVLEGVGQRDGVAQKRRTPISAFADAVGSPHDKVWDEPIWNTVVHIEDNVASVWTEYAFYLGTDFSHCGIDTFQLLKVDDGWKISYLADTRRREGCEVPEHLVPGSN